MPEHKNTTNNATIVGSLTMLREVVPAGESRFAEDGAEDGAEESASVTDTMAIRLGARPEGIKLVEGVAFRVGRASDNDLSLKDPDVSRFHAVFYSSKSGIVLSDLSSLNGTFVNEKRITAPVDLRSGDTIKIGKSRFVVELERQTPNPIISQDHTQLVGMRAVDITLLLVDIRRYTTMSQNLPSDEVVPMLQRWCEAVSTIVRDFGGEVDKYIGDCVMALWISSHKEAATSAKQALLASKEIIRKTKELAQSWPYEAEHPWSCRTVLNSGTAMMGVVAGGRGRDLTVLGDCVNATFRLEHVASGLERTLVMSETTSLLLKSADLPALELDDLGSVELEGRTGGMRIFCVSGY